MNPSEVRPFVQWLQERGMVDEIDIWRTAKAVLDVEGDQAALYAAQRADNLLEHGDTDGAAVWRRIRKAILELQTVKPSGPQH